jgi:acetylornithine deacetylase/succinyl-diaminopimelate desuccinylase-like protein
MPSESIDEIKATLARALADDQIAITQLGAADTSPPSELNEKILGAIEKVSHDIWPDAVVLPTMSAGATDGAFLRSAGIPTYGNSGMALEASDGARMHGKDERVPIKSFYQGNEYLYRLVKMLSGGA